MMFSVLDRANMEQAGPRCSGAVAQYSMRREEIRGKGMVLALTDKVLWSCKAGNVLLVWCK
jgi:hypothetical protein